MADDYDRLIESAAGLSASRESSYDAPKEPTPLPPLRPHKEYEDITLRELSIGFAGGPPQDITLYPEDTLEDDSVGNIRVIFNTLPNGIKGEFVAYVGHTQWHSLREVPHKREVGTLRPDPVKMMEEARKEAETARVRKLAERAVAEARMASEA